MANSANSGFRFKQFAIEHDECGMKVGTDSIVLGSWAHTKNARYILDIGTGSGLLALMLAQKTFATSLISAVEIEPAAVRQARNNIQKSKFANQIRVIECDIKTFHASNPYDLIISNPPYYKGMHKQHHNLIDPNQARVYARSQQHLSHKQLLEQAARLLSSDGYFYCVIPTGDISSLLEYALNEGLHLNKRLDIRSNYQNDKIRACLCFSRNKSIVEHDELVIYADAREYTEEYRTMCRDYYLNF